MLEVNKLTFSYKIDNREVSVLKELSLKVSPGEFICIQGPSGSGKSTLFYILGFLLKATSGTIKLNNIDVTQYDDDSLTLLRNQKIGFVFQQFHLLSKTTVLENILLPTRYPSEFAHLTEKDKQRAIALAEELGLKNHLKNHPNQLSGGQQQRVAIARALMKDISLVLADEPTGNLDSQTAQQILNLLKELNQQGKTIILITHDPEVAKECSKVYHLKDGAFTHVVENSIRSACPPMKEKEIALPLLVRSTNVNFKVIRSIFPLVIENILRNKTKSLLTMLGVVIGVAAVLSMVTLGQFAKRRILETYQTLGVNQLLIRGYPNWNLKATDQVSVNFKSFNWENDILPLRKIFPEINSMSPSLSSWRNVVIAGGIEVGDNKVTTLGVSPEYLTIMNRTLQAGRNINPFQIESRSPVCLIGIEIAKRLFLRTNPLGQIVTVSDGRSPSFPCQVIGVLSPMTSNKEWSPPNLHIIIPYTYFQTISQGWWNSQIHEIVLQVNSESDVETTGKKIKSYFEQKYGKSAMFVVDSDSTLLAQMNKFLNIFQVLLAAIALLSLLVGGIGINNMILVSVTERIKEFGIRKALGATHRSIRIQVLMESIVLCVAAGIIGIVIGFSSYELLIFGATQFVPNMKFEWVFEPVASILSLIAIISVGILSGLVPALRAEKLQIIEALRSE